MPQTELSLAVLKVEHFKNMLTIFNFLNKIVI